MINYKPGDQVVCIREDWRVLALDMTPPAANPVVGRVYTVRSMRAFSSDIFPAEIGLELEECGPDWWHAHTHFRPVKKSEKGMEMLRKLTIPKDKVDGHTRELEPAN